MPLSHNLKWLIIWTKHIDQWSQIWTALEFDNRRLLHGSGQISPVLKPKFHFRSAACSLTVSWLVLGDLKHFSWRQHPFFGIPKKRPSVLLSPKPFHEKSPTSSATKRTRRCISSFCPEAQLASAWNFCKSWQRGSLSWVGSVDGLYGLWMKSGRLTNQPYGGPYVPLSFERPIARGKIWYALCHTPCIWRRQVVEVAIPSNEPWPCGNPCPLPRIYTSVRNQRLIMSIKLLTTIGLLEGHNICHFSFDGYPLRNNKIGTSGSRACCMSAAAVLCCSCKSARRLCRLSKASGKNEAPSKKRGLYGYQVFPLLKVFVEKILKGQWAEFLNWTSLLSYQ